MTVDDKPMPTTYAGLTRDQALAQVFFKRIRTAEGLGMSLADQKALHAEWAEAKSMEEKQKVIQKVFLWSLKNPPSGKR